MNMPSRLDRQSFLGASSDELLRGLRVAIVGLGGGGSHVAQQLAHVGVGAFVLFDPDLVEDSNLNRLIGASERDADDSVHKVATSARLIRRVNGNASVELRPSLWQTDSEALRDADVVFGCVDTFVGRNELERLARRYHIPYIDIGMDVHGHSGAYCITGQVALSMPGRVCLHCMGVLRPDLIKEEVARYGEAGSRPQVVWANGVLASTAVGIFMQLVTPWHDPDPVVLLEYDGNTHELRKTTASTFLTQKSCPHFQAIHDLGDPWFEFPFAADPSVQKLDS